MSRYTVTQGNDDASTGDGDAEWRGEWPQARPDQVATGFAHELENVTCSRREAATREGSYTPTSFLHAGLAGPLYGSTVWSDPNGLEWLLLAAADGVWRLRDGHTPRKIAIPEALAAHVEIVPAFSFVLIFRGDALTPWVWNGKPASAFASVSQADTHDGTVPIPNGTAKPGLRPALLNQRLFVPHDGRNLAASDVLDYTRYDHAFDDFNLSGVGDDALVGLLPFQGTALLVGNDQSIQLLDGLTGDLSGARLYPVNTSIGVCGGATMAAVGADVFFLSNPGGVYRVTQIFQAQIATVPVPVSYPISPRIDRIHFPAAATTACAAVFDGCYWLAVPLDGAAGNNAILRYDTQLDAWQGLDTYPAGVQVSALHVTDYLGAKRLYAVDYAAGRVHLLEHGRHDVIGALAGPLVAQTFHPIAARLASRGYLLGENQRKRFTRGRVELRGFAPTYGVFAYAEGVNDTSEVLAVQIPDRRKYKVWGKPDYDPSNANDDHAAPDRQDYSVDVGTPFDPDEAGIDFDLEQTHSEAFTIRERGRSLQLVVTNTTGTLAVVSTQLDAGPADLDLRSH